MKDNFFAKLWSYLKYAWRELLAIVVVAVVDLVSKNVVESTMTEGQKITVIPGLFSFYFTYNEKAAYSFAFGLDKVLTPNQLINFFVVITIIALIAFFFILWIFRKRNPLVRVALGMIIGGAFGNLVDRMVLRKVRDFLCLTVFGKDIFGSFNVADMALVFGVILFAIYFIFLFDKDEEKLKEAKKACASPNGVESAENTPESEQPSETATAVSQPETETSASPAPADEQRQTGENVNPDDTEKTDESAEKNHDTDA